MPKTLNGRPQSLSKPYSEPYKYDIASLPHLASIDRCQGQLLRIIQTHSHVHIFEMSAFSMPVVSPTAFGGAFPFMDPLIQVYSDRIPKTTARMNTNDDDIPRDIPRPTTYRSTTPSASWSAVTFLPVRGLRRVKSGFSHRTATTQGSALSRKRSNVSEKFSKIWSCRPRFFAKMVSSGVMSHCGASQRRTSKFSRVMEEIVLA